jgi:predicted phosphodiesterase
MSRVGIVADLHAPFVHPMYMRFVQDAFAAWGVDKVHFVGDIVDSHAMSFWDHDPNGHSAEDEAAKAYKELRKWEKLFPKATVCIGNHDERHFRSARKANVPDRFLRTYKEVWETPGWDWQFEHTIDDVLYEHGTGTSGKDAAINLAMQKRRSMVIGHVHTYAGVKWHANPFDAIFGMNVGWGGDQRAYAFEYGKVFPVRPIVGCGIVLDGWYATFEPMRCGKNEPYHRKRAGRKAA